MSTHVCKASVIAGRPPVPDLKIFATVEIQTDGISTQELQRLYLSQGAAIVDALFESLPGGTIDQVLAEMLVRRASLLRVRFEPEPLEEIGEAPRPGCVP